jgi:hypothetical protein
MSKEVKGLACCQYDNMWSVIFWLVVLVSLIVIGLDVMFWRP